MSILLSIAVAVVIGLLMTRVVKPLGLPAVTAYLIAGVLVGPYCLGRLGIEGIGFTSMENVEQLNLISEVALGFIAFAIGNEFRLSSLKQTGRQATIVGIVQGLGAEIGLAIFAYKKWDLLSTTISGALAGVGCGLYYWLTNPAWSALRVSIYLIASAISGAVLAGAVMYLLQVAIAKTGVLDRFESGRTQELV